MTQEWINKAEVLLEALPYMRRFQGQTLVIKYGGAAMKEPELKKGFAQDITLLQMNIPTRFVEGLRVTDAPTMDVVEMVLAGKINKEIVNLINSAGGRARLLEARKLEFYRPRGDEPPEIIDIGLVGEVTAVNPRLIHTLQAQQFIPVIAPVGVGEGGETYNINADAVAGAVAGALGAAKLILLTDVPGVLDGQGQLVSSLTRHQAVTLVKAGAASGGMVPKLRCCVEALEAGVAKAHILDGRVLHAVLLEIFTDKGIGTEIVA